MDEPRGIPLENGEDMVIPIYIFSNSSSASLIASGEGLISKIDGRYFGSFDFEAPKTILSPRIDLSMNLVHGSLGERVPIGNIAFFKRRGEFVGNIEFLDDPFLDTLMRTARSLVNI